MNLHQGPYFLHTGMQKSDLKGYRLGEGQTRGGVMNPGKEQIQVENTRGGLLRFSGIELGLNEGEDLLLSTVESSDSSDMESFLMSFNSQEHF
jgi:hypothetical protein